MDSRRGHERKNALEKTVKEDKIEVVDAGDWKMVQVRTGNHYHRRWDGEFALSTVTLSIQQMIGRAQAQKNESYL